MITINQLSVVISQVTRTCLTLRIEEANAHQILTGNHDEFFPEKEETHLSTSRGDCENEAEGNVRIENFVYPLSFTSVPTEGRTDIGLSSLHPSLHYYTLPPTELLVSLVKLVCYETTGEDYRSLHNLFFTISTPYYHLYE
ncbi:hypothetical protein BgiBS90_000968 [Biomphalaria glabrata]|nr:hypothetical protein BgiBS90_000968 [Biomphalaria glabrata]